MFIHPNAWYGFSGNIRHYTMKPNENFVSLDLEFWSNVKLLGQRLGYYKNGGGFVVPSKQQIKDAYGSEGLNITKLISDGSWTEYGELLIRYFEYRRDVLNDSVRGFLMDVNVARQLFEERYLTGRYRCPMPLNKQTGDKKSYAYFTCIINMLIEENSYGITCDYDPRELTSITVDGYPMRTLSRRVDGAFPGPINPIAIWEIKEYYYTTTFGSRIADGVYETMLDGYELSEVRDSLRRNVKHYLMVDAYQTWWEMGKSYLCRIIDMLHMGFIDEAIFGREVIERIPVLVSEWVAEYQSRDSHEFSLFE